MTTNEFIKAVENLGYEAEKDEGCITITYKNKVLAHVFINELYRMSSYFSKTGCVENAGVLFALIFQYAITPIKDREEEKKYYLRHMWIGNNRMFLIKPKTENKSFTFQNFDNYFEMLKSKRGLFTEREIEEIKEKFNTNLEDFELVEVEE